MPLKGYKTITVKETVFKKLFETFENRKEELRLRNVRSYTAYAEKLLDRGLEQDIVEGRFKIVGKTDDSMMVMDYLSRKSAEVVIKDEKLFCRLDETGNCVHVGFVLNDPEIIRNAKGKGVRLRRA